MPLVRSLASKHCALLVALIISFSEIMPACSYCSIKGLVYITITALLGHEPLACSECIKLNICLSYDVCSVFNTKYTFLVCFCNL